MELITEHADSNTDPAALTSPPELSREDYGPVQLAGVLGWSRGDVNRAWVTGVIPPPDVQGRRWSKQVVQDLAASADALRRQIEPAPIGANKAAQKLTVAAHLTVRYADVEALAAAGLLDVVGDYKGWPLYDPRQLQIAAHDPDTRDALIELISERQAWEDVSLDPWAAKRRLNLGITEFEQLAAEQNIRPGPDGRYATADVEALATDDPDRADQLHLDALHTPTQAARQLEVSRAGLSHLVETRCIAPAQWVVTKVWADNHIAVDLYRRGDLHALRGHPDIDWASLRHLGTNRSVPPADGSNRNENQHGAGQ